MRASDGSTLGVSFASEDRMSEEAIIDYAQNATISALNVTLDPGDEVRTFTLTAAASSINASHRLADMDYIIVRPTEASGAEFAIESIRIVTRKEHLASIPSGVGWQGLADVFREAIVARAPERIRFDVELPSNPFLDLAIGTIEDRPVTFRVSVSSGSEKETVLLGRTVTRSGSGKQPQSISRGSRDARSRSSSAFLPSRKAPSVIGARRSYVTAAGSRSTAKALPRATRSSALLGRSPRESFSSSRIRSVEISSSPTATSARTRPCSRS